MRCVVFSTSVLLLFTTLAILQGARDRGGARDDVAVSVVKRLTVRNFLYRLSQWSPCTRTCGGGLRTRSVLCTDQDGILAYTGNACGNPLGTNRPRSMEFCNQVNCQTNASNTTLLPPAATYSINNSSPSHSRVLFIPYPPNWAAVISSFDDIGGVTLTTRMVIQQGFSVNRFGLSFSSPVSYSSASNGNIMANGVLLLSRIGGVREISPTSDIAYTLNTLSVGADTFMIDNYAIVTSNALLYRFKGMKILRDSSGGTLFINDATQTVVYSMNANVTQLIRNAAPPVPPSMPPLSYNLEVVGSNVQISFGNMVGAYRITGSISGLNNSIGTVIFTGTSIATSIQGISHFFLIKEATAESTYSRNIVLAKEYTDLFINIDAGQAMAINNHCVLSIIKSVMSFSGTVAGQFTVTSTSISFNGALVMQLMRGDTQTVTLTAGDQLSYANGALTVTSGGNQVFNHSSGIQRLTVQQGYSAAINDGSTAGAISGPGTLFVRKNMAFFTNDTSVVKMINEQVIMPVFTVEGLNTLTIDGNAVVMLESSRRKNVTSGQNIRYRNQTLIVFPSGEGNSVFILMNITQFVIYSDGDHRSSIFSGSMPEVNTATGTLYYDSSRAFFTNHNGVNDMIETALTSPTSLPSSGTTPSSDTTPSSGTTPSSTSSMMPPTRGPVTSEWSTCVIGPWNSCTRSCGVGVQFRTVRCCSGSMTQCTQDSQLRSNIPSTYQFCNTQDCPS